MEESRDTIDNIKNAETAINQDPPAAEPERQQYFMERAKGQLAELSRRLGRPLTCCITTFGCQMNARDSEKLLGILETIGYKAVDQRKRILCSTIPVRCGRMPIFGFTAAWDSWGPIRRHILT